MGSKLLESAEDHAKKRDCIRVHLETRSEKARELYEKIGSIFGSLPNYDGENGFHYIEKRLD